MNNVVSIAWVVATVCRCGDFTRLKIAEANFHPKARFFEVRAGQHISATYATSVSSEPCIVLIAIH